jgi:hypothetical protein
VTEEIDIWRSAHLLLQRHGTMAELAAMLRMQAMIKNGDQMGEAVWRRIMQSIKDLRRVSRKTLKELQ